MLFDLHVHTDISPCSDLRLVDILELAPRRGLDGVCITDHDTVLARERLDQGPQPGGLVVLVGMEYATSQGDFLVFGTPALPAGLSALRLLSLVEEAGGAAVAAHPCRASRPADRGALLGGRCHGVEIMNGRNSLRENDLAGPWPRMLDLAATGGSDAHARSELGRYGTRFSDPVADMDDLVRALRAGRCAAEPLHPGLYAESGAALFG
ncbi:PHP domain-containing protein [Desulfocurvus sp. DL9XJH121]